MGDSKAEVRGSYWGTSEWHLVDFQNSFGGVAHAYIIYRDVHESPDFEELKIKIGISEFCYRVYDGDLKSVKDDSEDFMQRNKKKLRDASMGLFESEKARGLLRRVLG